MTGWGDESPPWPPPREGQELHDEPDGSVWRWTGGRWAQVAGDGGRGEDARLWARAAEVSSSFDPGLGETLTLLESPDGSVTTTMYEGFEICEIPGAAPDVPRPPDDPGAHRVYQVWWDGAGWWAQDGRWHQVDPPGTFSDVLALHRRLDALRDVLQPVNLRGMPNEIAVARLLELAGDDDRLLRIELRHLGGGVVTDHARRLLVAALTDAPVELPTPETARRLREMDEWWAPDDGDQAPAT